jgi:hypothetical protein
MKNPYLPTSTATNAYDLLSDIAKLALEEPKRIYMSVVLTQKDVNIPTAPCIDPSIVQFYPACETVGCIAGWVNILTGCPIEECGDDRWAAQMLGLNWPQRMNLFTPDWWEDEEGQTLEHAIKVVQHIAAFQAKFEDQLKSKSISIPSEEQGND